MVIDNTQMGLNGTLKGVPKNVEGAPDTPTEGGETPQQLECFTHLRARVLPQWFIPPDPLVYVKHRTAN